MDGAPALDAEGVYFICPLCPTSTKRSDMDNHMTSCLETVGGMMLSCIETVLLEGKDLEYYQNLKNQTIVIIVSNKTKAKQ